MRQCLSLRVRRRLYASLAAVFLLAPAAAASPGGTAPRDVAFEPAAMQLPPMAISGEAGVFGVEAGDANTLRFNIFNTTDADAGNVRVIVTLPPELTVFQAMTTAGDTDLCTTSGTTVTCAHGTLPAHGSASYALRVRVALDVPVGTLLPVAFDLRFDGQGTPTADHHDDAGMQIQPSSPPLSNEADLAIQKIAPAAPVVPGETLTYRIIVQNRGALDAVNVRVTDTLPAALAFVSSPQACTAAGQAVTCTLPAALPSGSTAAFDLVTRLDAAFSGRASDIVNTASVASDTPDSRSANNVSDAVRLFGGLGTEPPPPPPPPPSTDADVNVIGASPYRAGDELVEYELIVTNQGPASAANVTLDHVVPSTLTLVSSGCGSAFPCSLGTLAPGEGRAILARYRPAASGLYATTSPAASAPITVTPPPGAFTSTATVTTTTPETQSANNSITLQAPASPVTYYLAEGATGQFWREDILIANPNPLDTPVTLRFLREDGSVVEEHRTIAAARRLTVRVNDIPGLEATTSSAEVISDTGLPLAVERTMRWDASGYAGHTETAVTAPASTWYFAEGAQGWFDTYLLLENPNDTAVDVTVKFLRDGEPAVQHVQPVSAHARLTLPLSTIPDLAGRTFGIVVTSATEPIVAERAMYFGASPRGAWAGGHASAGVTAAARQWFYAEGATGSFFDTFILLSNPQTVAANVTLEYLLPDGTTIRVPHSVPAEGRVTVRIDDDDPRLQTETVGVRISADVPIVTERSMYWQADPAVSPWSEGHNSFGLTGTTLHWTMADGQVGGPEDAQTFVLLSNPWDTEAVLIVTYLLENGDPIGRSLTLPPHSRYTLNVGEEVPEARGQAFGIDVASTNGTTISVERSIYWNANGLSWAAGTNATGTVVPLTWIRAI